ncbi:MAG: carbohydrate ABC transporter permease [Candidatus Bipolaricaulaceae bacterium]
MISLLLFAVFVAIPLYWALTVSFTPLRELLFQRPIYPAPFTFEHYKDLFTGVWGGRLGGYSFLVPLKNSLIVALGNMLISVIIGTLAGYALALINFKGKEIFSTFVLFAYVFPPFVIMIALRLLATWWSLRNTLHGLVLYQCVITVPYCTWMLRSYFLSFPKDVEEAAMVDGCTRFQALIRVVLPVSLPGVVAAATFAFTLSWQDYIMAFILLDNDRLFTVPMALSSMVIGDLVQWGRIMAAALISSLPPVVVYYTLQRYVVAGLTGGAVKG